MLMLCKFHFVIRVVALHYGLAGFDVLTGIARALFQTINAVTLLESAKASRVGY
jgi:hypothetical protein